MIQLKSIGPRKLAFMAITAVLITAAGIYFRQSFVRMLPLYISLYINILQSDVNRFAFLLASFNAVLYAWVYYYYGLYASAVYALFLSCPMQLVTFINWSRKSYEQSTQFRTLTKQQILLIVLGYAVSFLILYYVLSLLGSNYMLFDNAVTLFGVLLSLMMMFRFRECAFLMIPNAILRLGLYIAMVPASPEQLTYVIYAVYLLVCAVLMWKKTRTIYAQQQTR